MSDRAKLEQTLSRDRWQCAAFGVWLQGPCAEINFKAYLISLGLSEKEKIVRSKESIAEIMAWGTAELKKQGVIQ